MAASRTVPTSNIATFAWEALAFIVPVAFYLLLTGIRLHAFVQHDSVLALINAIGVAMLAFFFLTRPRPKEVDRSFGSLFAAWIGNFLPFCLILRDKNTWAGDLPLVIGLVTLVFAIWALLCLNRSLGIAPANRGIKTNGPYRLVRHPLYIAVIVSQIALVMEYPSLINVAVILLATVYKWRMIINEERTLSNDPEYVSYMERVRYRIIPGVV